MSQKKVSEQELKIQIRWLIRRDMHDVLTIERASFDHPWTEEDFLCCLRQRNCIGMVAEHDHRIIGFMIYELHKSKLRVLNFATTPDMRRHGIDVSTDDIGFHLVAMNAGLAVGVVDRIE